MSLRALPAVAAAWRVGRSERHTMSVEHTLVRLRRLALALPRPNSPWEERPRFEAPAAPQAIAELEQLAGFPLPADFLTFLTRCDAVVGMSVHNGYWIGGVESLVRRVARSNV